MGIDWFLSHLKTHFNQKTQRQLISSFRQDHLVWKALATLEHPEDWIAFAGNDQDKWLVSTFSLFSLRPGLFFEDYQALFTTVPDELKHKSEELLKAIRLTGLEPSSLSDAALLALTLRDYRLEHQSWNGLLDFIDGENKGLELWKTAFVVLPALANDYDQALITLIDEVPLQKLDNVTKLIKHVVFSTSMDDEERFQFFSTFSLDSSKDFQLALLRAMDDPENSELVQRLAQTFLSEEDENGFYTEQSLSIEDLRTRGQLEQFAGLNQEAINSYEKSREEHKKERIAFLQKTAKDLEKVQPDEALKIWEEILSLDPDNETYISEYAEFLIAKGDVHQALYLLNTLSDNTTRWLFSVRHPQFAAIQPNFEHEFDPEQLNIFTTKQKSRFLSKTDKQLAAEFSAKVKNFTVANELINKALFENPNDIAAIELAGQIQQRLANLPEAIQNFSMLSILEPENREYKQELTQLYIKAHEPQKALETFSQVIESDTSVSREDSLYYAKLAIDSGQPDIAIPIAQDFLSQDSLDGEAMVILSEALIQSNRTDEARDLLKQASALAPEKTDSWLALARIWENLGESDQALSTLQKAQVALPDDAQILYALGKLYLAHGQSSEAAHTLKQALNINPESMDSSIALTKALLNQGKTEEAWDTILPFESEFNSNPQLALVLADTLAAGKEHHRANVIYKFAWQSLKSNESLVAYIRNLLTLSEHDDDKATQTMSDLQELLPSLQDRTATFDASFEMRLLESDVKARLGQLEEAYEDYIYLLDQPEAKAPRFYQHLQRQIGLVAFDLGFEDIAMASLQEAVSFNANDLTSRHALSHAYLKSGLIDEAISNAQTALQLASTDSENVLWYAKFMQTNQRPHDAIQALKDAVYLRPYEQVLHLSLAQIYLENKAIDESKITLSKMLETSDISTSDYLKIASLYTQMNETKLATDILERSISENENPNYIECCELGYALLDNQQSSIALDFLDKVKQKHGHQPGFSILRADAYCEDKQYLPALQSLEPLLKRAEEGNTDFLQSSFTPNPSHGYLPFDLSNLQLRAALLYRALGNYSDAVKYAQFSLKSDPANVNAQLIAAELALSIANHDELNHILESLNNKAQLSSTDIDILRVLTLDSMLIGDMTKVGLLYENFLGKDDQNLISMAVSALIAENQQQTHQSMAFLQIMKDRHTSQPKEDLTNQAKLQHFINIWENCAVALVAWKLLDWDFADQLFRQCVRICESNPRLNLTLAEYLADKARMKALSKTLKVRKRLAKDLAETRTDEALFDEQVSMAKRILSADIVQSVEVLGKAQFTGHLPEEYDLETLVLSSKLAIQAVAVIKNPSIIAQIMSDHPHDDDLQFQYAIKLLEKQPAKSAEILNKMTLNPSRQALHYAALAIAQADQAAETEESLHRALSIWSDEPEWLALLAKFQMQQNKLSDAKDSLSQAIELEPNNSQYWQSLGKIKWLEKDFYAARIDYEKANTLEPNNTPVLEALADLNRQLGEYKKAIDYQKQLLTLDPDNLDALESLAELHFIIQDYDHAIDYANKVIDSSLKCERALKVKIETLIILQSFDEAKKLAQDAMIIAKDPIAFEIYRIRIEARENPATGLRMATSLAHEHPEYPNVLNLLAQYQILLDQSKNAEKTLLQSLKLDNKNAETLLALGALYRLYNQHETAQVYLNQAIEQNPSLIEAYLELGQSYEDQRLNDQALKTYNKAIEQVSKDPRAYVHAANAYKASRDFRSAELMLQKASQLAPTDQSIRRQLAAIVAQNLLNNLQEATKRK
jgi:tetratricopeptide (TPR) repeat protein